MAMGTEPRFPVSIDSGYLTGVASGQLFAAGANGARVDHFFISSAADVARECSISVDGVTAAVVSVPAYSGQAPAVACVSVLDPVVLPFLGSDCKWYLKASTAISVAVTGSYTDVSFHLTAGQY